MFQAFIRFSIELTDRVSLCKFGNRPSGIFARNSRHVTAEMICAVVPFAVSSAGEEQVIHCPAVKSMPEFINQVLAVGHEYYMVMCPAKIQIKSRTLYLIDFSSDLRVIHLCTAQGLKSGGFPTAARSLGIMPYHLLPDHKQSDKQ